jgi:hypothetical protein
MIPDDRTRLTIYTSALGTMEERMKKALPPYLTMSSQNRKITCRLTVSFMNVTAILTSRLFRCRRVRFPGDRNEILTITVIKYSSTDGLDTASIDHQIWSAAMPSRLSQILASGRSFIYARNLWMLDVGCRILDKDPKDPPIVTSHR